MAPEQRFSLTWNDYKTSLVEAFDNLRGDRDFVDITLACEGRKFQAHKMLLAACSPYFRDLLKGNPCQHPIIILRETSARDLRAVLEFVYNGEVSVEERNLDSFIKSAAALQIRGLTEKREDKSRMSEDEQSLSTNPDLSGRAVEGTAASSGDSDSTSDAEAKNTSTGASPAGTDKSKGRNKRRRGGGGAGTSSSAAKKAALASSSEKSGTRWSLRAAASLEMATKKEEGLEEVDDDEDRFLAEEGAMRFGEVNFTTSGDGAPLEEVTGPFNDDNDRNMNQIACRVCGKVFQTKNALLDHVKVHWGKTQCTVCGKVFSTLGNMKRHREKVHPVKPGSPC